MDSKGSFCIHKSPPPVPKLSQVNSAHVPIPLLEDQFNIIVSSTLGSSRWFLSLRFPAKILYASFLTPIRVTCPAQLILLDLITQ